MFKRVVARIKVFIEIVSSLHRPLWSCFLKKNSKNFDFSLWGKQCNFPKLHFSYFSPPTVWRSPEASYLVRSVQGHVVVDTPCLTRNCSSVQNGRVASKSPPAASPGSVLLKSSSSVHGQRFGILKTKI